MSQILKFPETKPVVCKYCGCIYQYEDGDVVNIEQHDALDIKGDWKIGKYRLELECPVCLHPNTLETI
jgi:hypothetical protein